MASKQRYTSLCLPWYAGIIAWLLVVIESPILVAAAKSGAFAVLPNVPRSHASGSKQQHHNHYAVHVWTQKQVPTTTTRLLQAIRGSQPEKPPLDRINGATMTAESSLPSTTSAGSSNSRQMASRNLTLESLRGLADCKTDRQARKILQEALQSNQQKNDEDDGAASRPCLYQSITIPSGASAKGISDGDLAIQTRTVNKKYKVTDLIELNGDRDADRASLSLLSLTVASTFTAIVANQNLPGPEIVRFLVVWVLSFAPLAFVGYGIATPSELQTVLVSLQRQVFPAYRKRMIQHEAGHFLMGHLLGWPVAGYTANAVKNAVSFYPLADTERGTDLARQLGFDKKVKRNANDDEEDLYLWPGDLVKDVPYFSKEGRGREVVEQRSVFRNAKNYTAFLQLTAQNEPKNAWPYRGFDDLTLDQLAVISVAGVCAEILAFGNAEGGLADLSQLRQIFNSAEQQQEQDGKMSEREMDNRIRYAMGYTMSQLRRHLGALDALAEVMERDGSIAECVLAIETCNNVSGQNGIWGDDYELRRRKAFREEGVGWIERLALGGGDRNFDTNENGLVEGKGGGYKKETFRLTGDDPLYAAIGVALVFLVWASSGGLSLH